MPKDYQGPTWADAAMTVREIEKAHRCRLVVEFAPSVSIRGGWSVDMRATRVKFRNNYWTVYHTLHLFPNKQAKSLPALVLNMAYECAEGVAAFDELPTSAKMEAERQAELPFPPSAD